MCGILGLIQTSPDIGSDDFGQMLDTLSSRGPDGRGIEQLEQGTVLLGHRRLAIIDLTPQAAQPMSDTEGLIWLVFNGEIYNYRTLRQELQAQGHRFRTQSDSEVILQAYIAWGDSCVHRLRGIFAFGLWDGKRKRLLLVRDPLGIKPLYYGSMQGRFAFASQPKAIISAPGWPRQADAQALQDYLAFGYVPHDRCAFAGLNKLPAGHLAVWENGTLAISPYWHPTPANLSPIQAREALEDVLIRAVDCQLVSDVQVGCFLSGGIDSSLLVALASRRLPNLRTFTIGFAEEVNDEREFARLVARHYQTQHAEQILPRAGMETRLLGIPDIFDEPFDANGPLPFLEVAALARRQGTYVALGGDGADELFAGYLRYDDFDRPARLKPNGPGARLWQWLRRQGIVPERKMGTDDLARYFAYEGCLADPSLLLTRECLGKVLTPPMDLLTEFLPKDGPAIQAAQMLDIRLYLVDHILCKVDRAAMAHGVEARVPFLDQEVVETSLAIPLAEHYRRGERKALLKAIARRHLPPEVVTTRKKGFSSPLGQWANTSFYQWGNRWLADGALVQLGLLRPDWADGLALIGANSQSLGLRPYWLLLGAELWARRWLLPELWPENGEAIGH